MALAVGTKAPDFSLATKTADGPKQVKLSDNFGKQNTLLLFFPMAFTGVAEVCEWFDDASGRFRIEVDVRNRRWGPLFGYRGSFAVEWREVGPGGVPHEVRPRREERRE